MALKSYSRSTLEGNWAEDRAPEMAHGVFPDYGVHELETSSKADYRRPKSHKDFYHGRRQGIERRFGMVTPETISEARMSYGAGEGVGSGFGAVIKTHGGATDTSWFQTTSAGYGREAAPDMAAAAHARREVVTSEPAPELPPQVAVAATSLGKKMVHSALARPAGGPGSKAPERGISGGGSIGEQFVEAGSATASRATAVQRSWYPSVDPAIAARNAARAGTLRPDTRDVSYMSLPLGGGGADAGIVRAPGAVTGGATAAWQAPRRKATITRSAAEASRVGGVRIFADE